MIIINKATIILSFVIIFSTITVYEISQSFFYPIVLNVIYLLIWVIATYHLNIFQSKNEICDENKTIVVCPMCKGKGWVEKTKMECVGRWDEDEKPN